MHKQHPQTAYRKDAVLIGTIFENCDNGDNLSVIAYAMPQPLSLIHISAARQLRASAALRWSRQSCSSPTRRRGTPSRCSTPRRASLRPCSSPTKPRRLSLIHISLFVCCSKSYRYSIAHSGMKCERKKHQTLSDNFFEKTLDE